MLNNKNSKPKNLLQYIELLGKPILFLFTIFGVFLYAYLYLITIFTRRIFSLGKSIDFIIPWKFVPQTPFRIPHINIVFSLPSPKLFRPKSKHHQLNLLNWKFALFSLSILLLSTTYYLVSTILRDLPNPKVLKSSPPALSTKIYDRNGTLLYQIYRDENRTLINLDDLPTYLINATIASEDKNFYSHHGISLSGISRAFFKNFNSPYLQGGSTITQQLVKNALLSPEKTIQRKLKEIALSLWTERMYSKDEILELYFNYVPYGGTAYGIEEGAKSYFGKNASDLTLPEAALLAGLPVAPTTLSPFGTNPHLVKMRQTQVLTRMLEDGYISENDKNQAENTPLSFKPQGTGIEAPHFVMYVESLLAKLYGDGMVTSGGLEVTTTLDLSTQKTLEHSIDEELEKLTQLNVGNGAGMVVNPQNGDILAMVGSRNYFDKDIDGQVNVALMPRQPGSSIKPITYSLALMNGLTPTSRIEDSPVCFVIKGQPNYCPKNYDNRFHGNVTLRTALASSYNIPAIKLLNSLGINNMVTLARKMGITTWEDTSRFGLSLTLGGGEVTMYDMSQVYSVLATGGEKIPLHPLLSVKDGEGNVLKIPSVESKKILPTSVAYQISSILADNQARSPAFGPHSVLNVPGHTVAVKTGTTNNLRDNWTIGYTQDLLVATWVGNNDNVSMSSVASGITGASPIWNKTITALLKDKDTNTFTPPENMVQVNLSCSDSPHYEYFVRGTEPKIDCSNKGQILDGVKISQKSPSEQLPAH